MKNKKQFSGFSVNFSFLLFCQFAKRKLFFSISVRLLKTFPWNSRMFVGTQPESWTAEMVSFIAQWFDKFILLHLRRTVCRSDYRKGKGDVERERANSTIEARRSHIALIVKLSSLPLSFFFRSFWWQLYPIFFSLTNRKFLPPHTNPVFRFLSFHFLFMVYRLFLNSIKTIVTIILIKD